MILTCFLFSCVTEEKIADTNGVHSDTARENYTPEDTSISDLNEDCSANNNLVILPFDIWGTPLSLDWPDTEMIAGEAFGFSGMRISLE